MNDILDRLRSVQNNSAQYAAGSDIMREAANEIEQLRAESDRRHRLYQECESDNTGLIEELGRVRRQRNELRALVAELVSAGKAVMAADDMDDEEDIATVYANLNDVLLMAPAQALDKHDIKVIEQFKDELVSSVQVIFRPHIEGVCAVVTQKITRQAEEGSHEQSA